MCNVQREPWAPDTIWKPVALLCSGGVHWYRDIDRTRDGVSQRPYVI